MTDRRLNIRAALDLGGGHTAKSKLEEQAETGFSSSRSLFLNRLPPKMNSLGKYFALPLSGFNI
jgi:hypothetical protein